jgi:hypothetical protein
MTTITSPTIFAPSADTVVKKGGIFKISSLGHLEYISKQKPRVETTTLSGLIELAQLGTTIIDGGYIKTNLVDSDTLLADVLFIGDMLEGGYLKESLINVSSLMINMGLGALAYEDVVEAAQLGSTLISGGFIRTSLIDTDAILADIIVSGDLGDLAVLDAVELSNLGSTIISGGYIKTSILQTDVLRVGQADLTANNTSYNTSFVGSYLATDVAYWAGHPAEVINANTTTISGGKITTGSIAADKIIANSLTANQIAANAITAIQLASNSVTAAKIMAGQVIGGHIATRTLTADKIAANSLTVTEIWGLARINGNRLNVVAAGGIGIGFGQYATITHNLGRYVVIHFFDKATDSFAVRLTDQTVNSFTFKEYGGSNGTLYYAYI